MDRGFIQIPIHIAIAIVVGVLAVGGASIFGAQKYADIKVREAELENQLEELQGKQESDATTTPTTTTELIEYGEDFVPLPNPTPDPVSTSIPIPTPTPIPPSTAQPEYVDFTARCWGFYDDEKYFDDDIISVAVNETFDLELSVIYEQDSKYEMEWSNKPELELGHGEARFDFGSPGNMTIDGIVTSMEDGYSKTVDCPLIIVDCNEYYCMTLEEKQENSLSKILDEIDTWFGNGSYFPETMCQISESIIRGFEYEYETILGGVGIPGFEPDLDCANEIAITVYEAKIKVLKSVF